MDDLKLVELAVLARENSYSPYSGFKVGAALLSGSGKVFAGCNIENSAYSSTVCAERTAFFKAVSEGERSFEAIAVAGWSDCIEKAFPCGVCRQVMAEFCKDDFRVLVVESGGDYREFSLGELLPHSFKLGGM